MASPKFPKFSGPIKVQGFDIKNAWIDEALDELLDAKRYDINNMTIEDYFNLIESYYNTEVIQGIIEAQARNVDYSDLWLDKKNMDFNKPTMVRIGEDIPISYLYQKAEIKWIKKDPLFYKPDIYLRKDQCFVFNNIWSGKAYFELYEFPTQGPAPLLPKTDFYLYPDKSTVDNVEYLYVRHGIIIVKKLTPTDVLTLLDKRVKLIETNPTGTNVVLACQAMDAIILNKAKEGKLDSFLEKEKVLDRFEKLKNLALGTTHFEERKLAFSRCYQSFQKLIGE